MRTPRPLVVLVQLPYDQTVAFSRRVSAPKLKRPVVSSCSVSSQPSVAENMKSAGRNASLVAGLMAITVPLSPPHEFVLAMPPVVLKVPVKP